MNREPSAGRVVAGLGVAVAAVSSAALLILVAFPLPPLVVAAGRVLVTGLALGGALVWARVRGPRPLSRIRRWGPAVAAAALLAVHFAAWIASLSMTSVVRSTTLVATQPLFAALVGRSLGDRASWTVWVGVGVALVGTAVMVGVGANAMSFGLGDALALLAALAAASYLVVGRSVRLAVPLRSYLCTVHLLAGGFLCVAAVLTGDAFRIGVAQQNDWLAVVALGLLPGVVGHGLLNWGVRHVPVHVVSLAILLEPAGATGLAWAVLGEPVASRELMGAAILLAGVGVALPRRRSGPAHAPAEDSVRPGSPKR